MLTTERICELVRDALEYSEECTLYISVSAPAGYKAFVLLKEEGISCLYSIKNNMMLISRAYINY